MNGWFDVPDGVGVWFGVRVMLQFLLWWVVIASLVRNWRKSEGPVLIDVFVSIALPTLFMASGSADELLSVFAFLFGINPSGW